MIGLEPLTAYIDEGDKGDGNVEDASGQGGYTLEFTFGDSVEDLEIGGGGFRMLGGELR